MEAKRFDHLIRAVTERGTRRSALSLLIGGVAGFAGLSADAGKKKKQKAQEKQEHVRMSWRMPNWRRLSRQGLRVLRLRPTGLWEYLCCPERPGQLWTLRQNMSQRAMWEWGARM